MAKLRLLCSQGDKVVEWDPSRLESGERDARAAIVEAERIFEQARREGATAFKVEPGEPAKRLESFDPRAREMVIVPRIAGGAISPDERLVMTPVGMARLEEEFERLRTVDRAELATRLREARESPGDQSDNLELLQAQHDLSILEARIADLEYALAQAQVVEAQHGDLAELGSTVVVRDQEGDEDSYVLVGPAEAVARERRISIASPVGRALLGTRPAMKRRLKPRPVHAA